LDDKAQTAIEYLLLIGVGIFLVIAVAALIKNFVLTPTLATAGNQTDLYRNMTNTS
jgi:hypothetical protein